MQCRTTEDSVEDFSEKIAKLRAQFNPAHMEIAIRKLIFLARTTAVEHAEHRLMLMVRGLIETVVIVDVFGTQRTRQTD